MVCRSTIDSEHAIEHNHNREDQDTVEISTAFSPHASLDGQEFEGLAKGDQSRDNYRYRENGRRSATLACIMLRS